MPPGEVDGLIDLVDMLLTLAGLAGGTAQGLGKFQNNYADYFRKNSDDLKAPAALTGDDWPTIGDVRGLLERNRGSR
jgi:hypothetical protein